jgi:hypothetical protein
MPIVWFGRHLIDRWYREVGLWDDSRSSQITGNTEVTPFGSGHTSDIASPLSFALSISSSAPR